MMNNKLSAIAVLLVASMLNAQVFAKSETLTDTLLSCSKLSDNLARLTCFDQVVEKQLVENATKEPSKIELENSVEQNNEAIDNFAKEQVKKSSEEKAKEVTSITLTISSLTKNGHGKWNITFDNGQKWQQKDSVRLNLKVGQRVVLTKGALSAVYLQKEHTKKRIKVKRLK